MSAKETACNFLQMMPVTQNVSKKRLENVIKAMVKKGESLVVVSTVCPPYETDAAGKPTYEGLGTGIEYNIEQHLAFVPPAVRYLNHSGVGAKHFFLMADTEVDLQPFLEEKLHIDADEFILRCQSSVDEIDCRVKKEYEFDSYSETPGAARFLKYFGSDDWYEKYEYFRKKLRTEIQLSDETALRVRNDAVLRADLIDKMLGKKVSLDERIEHIIRQKSQYMAFASLMRDRFGDRLVVVNHATPNFAWMNDKLVREPKNQLDLTRGNYLPEIPLIELNISTMPGV